jgi:hypothetical protein
MEENSRGRALRLPDSQHYAGLMPAIPAMALRCNQPASRIDSDGMLNGEADH